MKNELRDLIYEAVAFEMLPDAQIKLDALKMGFEIKCVNEDKKWTISNGEQMFVITASPLHITEVVI